MEEKRARSLVTLDAGIGTGVDGAAPGCKKPVLVPRYRWVHPASKTVAVHGLAGHAHVWEINRLQNENCENSRSVNDVYLKSK